MGPRPRDLRSGGPGLLHTLALLAWGVLILAASVVLAGETGFWWLVLVFGAAVPVALSIPTKGGGGTQTPPTARVDDKERELLSVLGRHGEVGPALVAMETALTVTEAEGMLGEMAKKGHLEVRARDGVLAYALPGRRGEAPSPGAAADPPAPDNPTGHAGRGAQTRGRAAEPLADPLTERELEVLKLLASGRTNREIAADLFVSVGTVKAHAANIYRKLGARSRVEALARARDLGL